MQKFIKSKDYKTMKAKYEKEYFKLAGNYAWYDGDKIINRSITSISEHFKNKKVTITETKEDADGNIIEIKKEKNFYHVWSEDPDMREYDEVLFECDISKVKKNQFNLFDGIGTHLQNVLTEKNVDLEPIHEHFKTMAGYNNEHYNYLLDYFAHMVQLPHLLSGTCIVIISPEGVGKDIFSDFIGNIIGKKYYVNTDKIKSIAGGFNTLVGGKIFTVINETNPVESRERQENIKFMVTAKQMTIEGKYKDAVTCNNYCRFMFISNRLCAFPVEDGARRPIIMYASDKYLPKKYGVNDSDKYFSKLLKVVNDKSVQKAFLELLQKRDISKWNPKNFTKSDLHKNLEEAAKPPMTEFLYQLTYDQADQKQLRFSTTKLLEDYTAFLKRRNMKYECNQKTFNLEMIETYEIRKYPSNGRQYFKINIANLKDHLAKNHNCKYGLKEDDEVDNQCDDYDDEIKEANKNLSVKLPLVEQIEHYKKLVRDLELQLINEVDQTIKQRKVKEPTPKWIQQTLETPKPNKSADLTKDEIDKAFSEFNF
jgi:hypothetical protein